MIRKLLTFAALGVAVLLVAAMVAPMAYAASETTVEVPIGAYVSAVADFLSQIALPVVTVIVGWAARMLPKAVADYLAMLRVEQLLTRAVGFGVAAVKGAADGKVYNIDVGNKVVAAALAYAIEHAPSVVAWAGGPDRLKEKIISRLEIPANASVAADVQTGSPVIVG